MRKKIIWIVVVIMLIAVYPIIKKPHTISEIFIRDVESIDYIWIYSEFETYTCRDKEVIQEFINLIDQNKVIFTFKRRVLDRRINNYASFGFLKTVYTDFDPISDDYIQIKREVIPVIYFKYENSEFNNKLFSQKISQFIINHSDSFTTND
jgi:hypothetical protein